MYITLATIYDFTCLVVNSDVNKSTKYLFKSQYYVIFEGAANLSKFSRLPPGRHITLEPFCSHNVNRNLARFRFYLC